MNQRIGSLVVGSSVAFTLNYRLNPSAVRYNDSGSTTQWPSTRPNISKRGPKESSQKEDNDAKAPAESQDDEIPLFEDEDSAAWASFSLNVAIARKSISSVQWTTLGDKITDRFIPQWAYDLPDYVAKLQREMNMARGSLAEEIWQEAQDENIHPEIALNARVRVGKDLCSDEMAFVRRRKRYTRCALAKYLEIPEADVDPKDVPTIAVCGSGGGLRALVAGAASYLSAQEAGLFDCATYTAGVSGSCWLQTLYNSSLGGRRHDKVIEHLKKRIGIHIAYPPSFLDLCTRAPTNKFLLAGSVERLRGDPQADFGLVDVYGLLLSSRLMIPRDELSVDDRDLKLSNQRFYLSSGANPLPIYAAVRHEIPLEDEKVKGETMDAAREKAKQEAWFQWFEFTPYELFCEEFEAGIPSWSIGRHFQMGRSVNRDNRPPLPELRLPLLMGIWGSAFCATLAHYYKEVRPVIKGLAGFGGIDALLEEKNDDLIKLHPIDPGTIPNFARGLENRLPSTCPKSIFNDEYLELMDAGMSNNLPLYPLLRRDRNVDIVVCFDASADIRQENWLSVAEGYAKQRGVRGWPVGAGWPRAEDETKTELDAADAATAQQAAGKIAETREEQRGRSQNNVKDHIAKHETQESDLGYCNVWVGTTMDRKSDEKPSQSSRVELDADWKLLAPEAGITVVYFPFLRNPKVEDVDPDTSPFLSTWNFIYSPQEIDKVVALARANFEAGRDQTKRTVRAVYERKKAKRLEAEEKEKIQRWKRHLREHGDHFQ
ncbi:hypothetical protein HO133_003060 [Letharia lupina]|uniref:Lysophospholipase n=1 Tax=Letharia lupina TaxID=560253 RepID=A0A8H6F9U9_9LECA|nr:uncharacterized protein HO133_003060 [Letharia lupina]KAF6220627.1 hypothetical protein HO133_003060 [Letharia lupina]